jgi:predicted RNA-binding protein with PIN domain
VRWLIDGYNVIRRSPELASAERRGLDAGRAALCRRLADLARASGDEFTVVFDGAGQGGTGGGGPGVRVVFSSARETADRVLARMAARGGAVVSNDREVRRAAARAGAVAIDADRFLARLDAPAPRAPGAAPRAGEGAGAEPGAPDKDDDEAPRGPRKGNPRRLPKRARAAARALSRLGRRPR